MEKKLGVYICKGCTIGDTVETDKLGEIATKKYKVPVCRTHDILCSPEGIDLIKNDISGEGVNTVVIAACSPRVKYEEFSFPGSLVERINIREFVAWTQTPKEEDTQSLAEDYMRMGIVKAQKSDFPEPFMLEETDKTVLVIGGGISGMTSALG
ncbi:MAG: heterodisulfide reductase subunit A, partial [Candidatus Mariimomonas ferrooxydans]